jgi:hypothetical protein
MTDQNTEPTAPDMTQLNDRFVSNANLLPATKREPKPRPKPGGYYLKFGAMTPTFRDDYNGIREDGTTYTIPGSVEVKPNLTIVRDADNDTTFAGVALNKHYRLSSAPVRFKGQDQNFSTLSAACEMAGVAYPTSENISVEELFEVARQLEGRETLQPVTLTVQGEVSFKEFFVKADGTRQYMNEKLFRTGEDKSSKPGTYRANGGEWAALGFIVNDEWTLGPVSENVEARKVWANLQPTDFGWKTR